MTAPSITDIASGLSSFIVHYETIRGRPESVAERLAVFFTSAGPMLVDLMPHRATVNNDPVGFANAMEAIASPLRSARDAGLLANPWALAGLKRREVANARVLAGLWSAASGGKIAIDFLEAFFNCLRSRPGGAALPSRSELADGYLIRTEDRPLGESADRIDITIEGRKFLIGIEVKIDAALGPDQLGRYQTAIRHRATDQGKRPTVIFLSLRHTNHSGVVNSRWHDVAAAARAIVPSKSMARGINHHLIECFAAHVEQF